MVLPNSLACSHHSSSSLREPKMLSLCGFPLCQTHTSEIESVEAGLACCLNQSHVGSCRSVITSKCEIITEENSREEECHVPRAFV